MPKMTRYTPGSFCWVALPNTDPEGTKAFYTEIMGWRAEDMPTKVGIPYTTFFKGDTAVAATYFMPPDMGGQQAQSAWLCYIAVESVDDTVSRVQAAGGTVIMPPLDIAEGGRQQGRMALIQDPTGAVVGLWRAGDHIGAELFGETGALCWNELYTADTDKAAAFYHAVFGWTVRGNRGADGHTYFEFLNAGQSAAGMLRIREEWGEVPPNWSAYFAVPQLQAALDKATGRGARLSMGPMTLPGIGTFALVEDPQGAYCFFIELA